MTEPCAHHWDIETPCGKPTLHGTCRLCGEEKDFPAAQAAPWENDPGQDLLPGKGYKEHQKYPLKRQKVAKPRQVPPETRPSPITKPAKVEESPVVQLETRPVKEAKVKRKTREVEERWPEILQTLQETGSINKTATKLLIPYTCILTACERHGVDVKAYQPMKAAGSACQKVDQPAGAGHLVIGLPNLGEALIGLGLLVLGSWLKQQEVKK
jgi:hypothetical protein